MSTFIHESADVQTNRIGENTKIWQFTVILSEALIGENCNINAHVFIENDVIVGDNVTVKSGVQLWNGVELKNNVFIGPNVTFTNDYLPRSKRYPESFLKTVVEEGASLGANATIIGGNTIGKFAMIGAGAVITKDVGNYELWLGNPAKHKGYVSKEGVVLDLDLIDKKTGNQFQFKYDELVMIK